MSSRITFKIFNIYSRLTMSNELLLFIRVKSQVLGRLRLALSLLKSRLYLILRRRIDHADVSYASCEAALWRSCSVRCFSPSLDREERRASPSGGMYGSKTPAVTVRERKNIMIRKKKKNINEIINNDSEVDNENGIRPNEQGPIRDCEQHYRK